MSKLPPVDLTFLLLENPARQMHMTSYQLFKLPPRQKSTFIPKPAAKPDRRSEQLTSTFDLEDIT